MIYHFFYLKLTTFDFSQIYIIKQYNTMPTIIIFLLSWMVLMTLLLWMMPNAKIKAIADFFHKVLPKIPLTGIIKLWKKD